MTFPYNIKSKSDFEKRKKRHWFSRFLGNRHNLSLHRLSYTEHRQQKQIRLLGQYLTSLAIIFILFGLIAVLFIFAWTAKDLPDPNKLLERNIEQTTTIYDREAKTILYQLHGDVNRRLIKLEELPPYVINATITIEDRDFYNHQGFSLRGIARALLSNIFGGSKVGGSTITQQFVKNAILSPEKTLTRKIKEVILAYRIEQKFSKNEILQMYFNEIPYGSVIYGVEAASQTYFGKSAKDVTLAEAAVLAAIPQRPTYFSPYGENLDDLFARQKYILNEMAKLGYISQADADKAASEKINFKPKKESMIAPHFVMYVKQLLADQYGERYAEESGLKVVTTLDKSYQELAEKAIANHIDGNKKNWQASNASLVALDPKTGQILAMVGSADYYDDTIDGQVNVALRPRQPGSSFKPLVYASAFEKGFTPETILFDVETVFKTDTKDYSPKNYDSKEHGPVTMRQALAGSLNIPAVKTLYLAGIDNVLDWVKKLGYTTLGDRSRFGLSLVLGGGEVKLLEHTAAFATFASEGTYREPIAILRIEDSKGKVIYEAKENRGEKTFKPETIQNLTSILSDNDARAYIFGQNNSLTLPDRPVAAKTGTTNDYRDAWTVGYTPSLTTGVWVGNNNNSEMKRGADGSVVAAPIWNEFMRSALAGKPAESFNPPPPNTSDKPILKGLTGGMMPIKIDRITGKLATQYTPADLVEEKLFSQFHCILYYVNKDDPLGPVPANPSDDPQFDNWEAAVRNWAQKQGYTESEIPPPTEYDNIHIPENIPEIQIISLRSGDTIKNDTTINVNTWSKRGVKRVEYYIDNQKLYTSYDQPFSWPTNLTSVSSGIHALTAKAFDDVENSASDSIDLNFVLPNNDVPVKFSWLSPSNNATISSSSFPLTLSGTLTASGKVDKISVVYTLQGQDSSKNITTEENPSSNAFTASWTTPPAPGSYRVYTLIFQTNGKIIVGDDLKINISQ